MVRDLCSIMLCMGTCNTESPWVAACPTRRNDINKLWHILYGTSQNCQNYISKSQLRRTKLSQNVLRQNCTESMTNVVKSTQCTKPLKEDIWQSTAFEAEISLTNEEVGQSPVLFYFLITFPCLFQNFNEKHIK